MITKSLNDLSVLEKSLDSYWLRNDIISNNIANVDTPGYKRKDVKFEEILKKELSKGGSADDAIAEVYTQEEGSSYRLDGNNVDIDNEMSELVKNAMRYNVVLSQLNKKFTSMRTAMNIN